MLLDEIDLHLHPKWQRVLRDFLELKLPNFQILGTTHSPLTAQQSSEGELYFLQRPGPMAPAALGKYEGNPSLLLPHQLLLSPAFNVSSIQSREVETMKDEYRALKEAKQLTSSEKKRFDALADKLSDVPDWTRDTETDRRQVDLLERIEAALSTQPRQNP